MREAGISEESLLDALPSLDSRVEIVEIVVGEVTAVLRFPGVSWGSFCSRALTVSSLAEFPLLCIAHDVCLYYCSLTLPYDVMMILILSPGSQRTGLMSDYTTFQCIMFFHS